jgi:hypothetical protein
VFRVTNKGKKEVIGRFGGGKHGSKCKSGIDIACKLLTS